MATHNTVVPQMNAIDASSMRLNPWERKAYTLQQEHEMYCDWGKYFSSTQKLDLTAKFYDKALSLKANDARTFYYRSVCRRKIAHTEDALSDALKANELMPHQVRHSMAIGDAFYELNQFENALIEFYKGKNEYSGSVIEHFLYRISVIEEQLKTALGEMLEVFFLKNKHFIGISEMLESKRNKITYANSKTLGDEKSCDVMSITEKDEIYLSPLEVARRQRSYKIFNQTYFTRNWVDAIFLHELKSNETFSIKQFTESGPILADLINSEYQMVKKFLKMLQARRPLYCKTPLKSCKKKLIEQHKTRYLNGVQYQTRRNMIITLRHIKQLRSKGRIEELVKYVESVMGDYVVLKTYRVMPWKFEFMNDVYNTLGLAFADSYTMKEAYVKKPFCLDTVAQLLKVPKQTKKLAVRFEFGKKSTSIMADYYDEKYEQYKKLIGRLETRMLFAKYSIEKTYLRYEIARVHLKQCFYGESYKAAKSAIEEARNCRSNLWVFLSLMLIVTSHAACGRHELCTEVLNEAYNIALKLSNEEICYFVDAARQINEEEIFLQQKNRSVDTIRKRKLSSSTLNVEDENLSYRSHSA